MATHARRAEFTRSEGERLSREREARRRRFEAPLFDFVSAHSDSISEEKAIRQRKLEERQARLREIIGCDGAKTSSEDGEVDCLLQKAASIKPRISAPDGSVDLYEAMYLSKGAQLTPEDYSDHNALPTAQGKEALANINSIILKSRSRRALDCRDEPTDLNLAVRKLPTNNSTGFMSNEKQRTASSVAAGIEPGKSRQVAVETTPWFDLMFRHYDGEQNNEWRRKLGGLLSKPQVDSKARLAAYQKLQPLQQLHEEILGFVTWADLTEAETAARTNTLANISIISQALWPSAELAPFGSFFNGLSLPEADVDICIQRVPSGENNRNEIYDLARLLRYCPFAQDITTVTKARVPIVKFRSSYSDVQVDLTINQESALETSEFIHERLKQWRPLRPLILVVKLLLRNDDLNETYKGGVGSYMLLNMITHHLQMEAKLRDEPENRKPLAANLSSLNLGELLLSFFQRYANFDYVFDGIDIRGDGALIAKSEYSEEMCNRLYVVSPLEPRLDVGKSSYNMDEVVDLFSRTYKRLRAAIENHQRDLQTDCTKSMLAQLFQPTSDAFRSRKIDPSSHPCRSDFSIYNAPRFPSVSSEQLERSYYGLQSYIRDYQTRPRNTGRNRAGPYESRNEMMHRRYEAIEQNGGNNRRRPALARDYDRTR